MRNPQPRVVPADKDFGLSALSEADSFFPRHVGPTPAEVNRMLQFIGVDSLSDLIAKIVPDAIQEAPPEDALPPTVGEAETLSELRSISKLNHAARPLLGQGFFGCILPSAIRRNLLENPGWYTAYTPYQAEISQGRLELLLDFQQMIIDITGLPITNASLLDEASAAAEAALMMWRADKKKRDAILVDPEVYPSTRAVLHTRAEPLGLAIDELPPSQFDAERHCAALVAYPSNNGAIRDHRAFAKTVKEAGATLAVTTDLLALTLLEAPGAWGAEVAVGSSQRFGMPMMGGGPHAAFLSASERFTRSLPGRIVGVSHDKSGKPALRLALQTREQHIRREKATSNICTAQALPAMVASLYALWHGPDELSRIAERVHRLALLFAESLRRLNFKVVETHFFDTVTVELGARVGEILTRTRSAGFLIRDNENGSVSVSFDETVTTNELFSLLRGFAGEMPLFSVRRLEEDLGAKRAIPDDLRRKTAFLTHEIFHMNRSETEFMRYLRRLREQDIALDLSMIPLGSCTMKLNAAVELEPILWRQFAEVHPFSNEGALEGYQALTRQLETWLARLAGFDAVSLQPNAGSQGEYAGLLAIRRYHLARGGDKRNLCFIPISAHGTNPASAVMAGFKVVLVQCTDNGDIDLEDLRKKVEANPEACGAAMITYPSTHGVFEEGVTEVISLIHQAGGQVYMDGANMNALIGICSPGKFGADVSHFNLHKTFCIPHGGGGPGVGPIGVRAHLAPYLPEAQDGKPVAAAQYGSAGILPISWVYLRLMGGKGIANATRYAILGANYLAKVLEKDYGILYTGKNGLVAHEFILDLRSFKDTAGITELDVAKRLMDYGYHAPTQSWPVAGTLMVEPTESESKAELDRFASALIQIRKEIARIESGEWPQDDNPIVNAPHTAAEVTANEWNHPYTREEAAHPLSWVRNRKYWPPVGRIDSAAGDRNLVCTCPPMEEWHAAEDTLQIA